jgi:hypothetical protein
VIEEGTGEPIAFWREVMSGGKGRRPPWKTRARKELAVVLAELVLPRQRPTAAARTLGVKERAIKHLIKKMA